MQDKYKEFKGSKEDYAELTGKLEAIEAEGRETGKMGNRMCGAKGGKGKPNDSAIADTGEKDAAKDTVSNEEVGDTADSGMLRALRFLERTL